MTKGLKIPSRKKGFNLAAYTKHKSTPRSHKLWEFNPSNFSQLRKRCVGKKFVLALSGGKLKFACHLPLLRLIEVLGIKVDELWGVSAGAVAGGLWANGMSAIEIDKVLDDVNLTLMFDLFNMQAVKTLITARKNESPLRTAGIFPGIKIENYIRDLLEKNKKPNPLLELRNFYSVAYNISKFHRTAFRIMPTGKIKHLEFKRDEIIGEKATNGDLADIIRASMAMCGIYWPENIGGEYFLDGGLTEQLPILSPFITWLNDLNKGKEKRDLFIIGMELVYATPEAPPPPNPFSLISESFELLGDEIAYDHEFYISHNMRNTGTNVDLVVIRPEVPYTVLTAVPDFTRQIEVSKAGIIRELADK